MENRTKLRIGDMVRLNSGGPDCKVIALVDNQATIEWRGDDGELNEWTLPEGCFHLVGQVA